MPGIPSRLLSAPSLTVPLRYFEADPEVKGKPYQWINPADVPKGAKSQGFLQTPHPLPVRNLRGLEDELGLDRTGFQVVSPKLDSREPQSLAVWQGGEESRAEWDDDEWVKNVYYPETEALLKRNLGASRVVFFDHTIRKQDNTGTVPDTPQSRQPVSRVHVDQTPESAARRVRRHLPSEEVEEHLGKRYQIVNIWRPLRGPVLDVPLAFADYRSVDPEKDFVPIDLRYAPGEPVGETYGVAFNERHNWFYLDRMTPDEALLIKCFDSQPPHPGAAMFVPHTAFVDERYANSKEVAPRQSIELRALVFY